MVAELIHIECGVLNGIVNYKIKDKILRFELSTPYYNDYSEFRVQAPFDVYFESDDNRLKILDFDDKYVGHIPINIETSIKLSDEDVKWWLNTEPIKFEKEWQLCGGSGENNEFSVWVGRDLLKYSDWLHRTHEPYENLMFKVLNVFYHWYYSDDCKPSEGLMIFPEL